MRNAMTALAGWTALAAGASLAMAEPYIATAPDADSQLAAMVELYDVACLRAFPDDAAVAKLMAARGAAKLDAKGLRTILHDDPGVGWTLNAAGARFTVTVEAPPFHACGVRTMTAAGFPDLAPYRTSIAAYARAHPGFAPMRPLDQVANGVHSTLSADARQIPPGGGEVLIVGTGILTGEAARKSGETATEVRFVHQLILPDSRGGGRPAT